MPITSRCLLTTAALTVLASIALPAQAQSCADLAQLALPDTRITLAETVAAGAFVPGVPVRGNVNPYAELPAFCRVAATLAPSADSDIKIEVWLPAANWNRKLLGVGNGGWTGSIATAALATAVSRGYAGVSTDTGHEGGSASFALGHPEKLIDFAYRATHEMTVTAKAIVASYYQPDLQYSYFDGCSAGGRQGMKAAQLYPEDYDGIVAGSPGLNWTGRALQTVWVGQGVNANEQSIIPASSFAALNAAAIAACDGNDGVVDGVIENPQQCSFDPAVLQCGPRNSDNCLTPSQIETARRIYAPVMDMAAGSIVVPGLSPGSEPGWSTMAGAQPFGPGVDLFKYIVFQNPDWDYRQFSFSADVPVTLEAGGVMDALDPDLGAFFAAGGKLLSYHGWSDPQISPGSTVQYYQQVLDTMGGAELVQQNYRLFMVPGMNHCSGGVGTDSFDMLNALEAWVERGEVPAQVSASHVEAGETVRTRPLCPYPQSAVYSGSGSTDSAVNFSCQ